VALPTATPPPGLAVARGLAVTAAIRARESGAAKAQALPVEQRTIALKFSGVLPLLYACRFSSPANTPEHTEPMNSIDFLPWAESFDTGLPEVDGQHRRLVTLLNVLASHVAFRTNIPQLDEMSDELANYAVYHFQTEEAIWHEYLAGDQSELDHRATHASFVQEMSRLRAQQDACQPARAAEETLAFLARWLISHILESDRYMACTVLALRAGLSREAAHRHASAQMAQGVRKLADIVLSINATPATNALHLMSELAELRRTQVELQHESAKNRALLRAASDGVHVLDGVGNIIEVSDSFCAMLGYAREELVGSNMASRDVRFADGEGLVRLRQELDSPQRRVLHTRYRCRDGSLVDVDVSGVPVTIEGQRLLFYSARDVSERKQAEKQLADERQRLADQLRFTARLLDTIPNPVFFKDENGRYLGCNTAFEKYLGIERRDLIGRSIHDIVPAAQADRYLAADRTLFEQRGTQTYQAEVRYADGSLRDVVFNKATFNRADGALGGLVGVMLDVTERMRMESALKQQAAFTDCIIAEMVDGIAVCHEIPEPPHVRFTVWNPAMQRLTGYSLGEINQSGWQQALQVDEHLQEEALRRAERMRRGDHLRGEEWTIRRRDGERRTLQVHTTFVSPPSGGVHLLLVLRDATAKKAAEQLLRQQRDLAQRYLDTVQSLMLALDTEGRITMINRAGREVLGYREDELLGRCWFSTCLPQPKGTGKSLPLFRRVIAGEVDANFSAEDTVLCRDGSLRLIGWKTDALTDDAGRIIGTLSSGADIGARKEVEAELERYRTHLETLVAQRTAELSLAKEVAETANRAKSEFLSSMSHELRTPMNAIIGFAQMLEYDSELSADQQDNVHEILNASRHLLDLINEVLDLARIESGRIELSLETADIATVVDDCRHLIEPLAAPLAITLSTCVPAGATVHADRVRLKQALLNLLSNAVKYNRARGSIRLAVEQRRSEAGLRQRISVTDTGIGIAHDRLSEVFQPFTRLQAENSEIEGSGIGLTITKRLVELMGGVIGAESEVGVGSCFWIDLPAGTVARPGDDAADSDGTRDEKPQASDEQRVLCIDDNPSNLKLMAQILGRRGNLRLLTAHAPRLGIELALAHRPHLILLDINMPGMDGYEVLAVLQRDPLTSRTPVIAITANALARDIERGRAAGFLDYITKPIDVAAFLRVVEETLETQRSPRSE